MSGRPISHRRAARLLPAVLDHTLAAPLEAGVRAHAEACGACADALVELEAAETLLRRLPLALVPEEASSGAEARLAGLARWAGRGPALWAERLGFQAVGALAGAALVAVFIAVGDWQPVVKQPQGYQAFASLLQDDPGFGHWR